MHYSRMLLPTLKETPAEAELISHKLMLRAGMIRKLAAGIYSYLPIGYRVIRKIENIIRQEMNSAGAQELLLPVLNPAELWRESGRWELYGAELMRLKDRHGRDFCLGPTHEEVITDLVRREVRSYRDLPLNLYQIQTKLRDEIRPRFGIMRAREFIMKDAYSFDCNDHDAQISYQQMYEAYNRIFERCGLTFRVVEADSGSIGGSFSHEFMILADSGEERIAYCPNADYSANVERALAVLPDSLNSGEAPSVLAPLEAVDTPNIKTVDELCAFLSCAPENLVKTLILKADDQIILALVRGDHELNLIKLKNLLSADQLELADADTVMQITNAPVGFAGPVGMNKYRIIADNAVKNMINFITGANKTDTHYINVNWGRDAVCEYADIRVAQAGDLCPKCAAALNFCKGIEVGHIFKLGAKYSKALGAVFLDEAGRQQTIIMGCYGIGVGRTMAAAIEQNYDQNGIIWPVAIAPYHVLIMPLDVDNEQVMQLAEDICQQLESLKIECLLDDRDIRPGIKFKDADLIGIPLRLTIGKRDLKKGLAEIKIRKSGKSDKISPDNVVSYIKNALTLL